MEPHSPTLSRRNSIVMQPVVPPAPFAPPHQGSDLRQLHDHIKTKIGEWDRLISDQKLKQETSFVRVFNNVLERMKADLKEAEDKLESIDMLALADRHNTRLQRELHFFREECISLHAKLEEAAKDIAILKKDNQELKEQSESLQNFIRGNRPPKSSEKGTLKSSKRNRTNLQTSSLPNEEEKALMSLIHEIQSERPEAAITLLKTFLRNEVLKVDSARAGTMPFTSEASSRGRQAGTREGRMRSMEHTFEAPVRHNQSLMLQHNEALEIWEECVRTAKSKDSHVPKFMARESKYRLLQTFFGSERLIELLRRLLFGEKCCSNFNCLYNMGSARQEPLLQNQGLRARPAFELAPHPSSDPAAKYWSRLRKRSTQKAGGVTFSSNLH